MRFARAREKVAAKHSPVVIRQDLEDQARNTLIYVERDLILPIAARLIGTSVTTGMSDETRAGLNWVIAASYGYSEESSAEIKMSELFPEDIFNYCYPYINDRQLRVNDFCQKVARREILPPNVVTVKGVLRIPGIAETDYDPFDPPEITIPKVYRMYGYRTALATVEHEGFSIPLYVFADSIGLVYYAHNKPVEVVGVVKWAPTYEVGGNSVSCILLCAALLLAR